MADDYPELMQLPSVDDIHELHRIFDSGVGGSTRRESPEGRRWEIIFTACSSLDPHTIFHFTGGVWYCGHSHGRVIRPMSGMPNPLLPWPLTKIATRQQIVSSCRQLGLIPLWSKHEGVDGYAPVPCDEQTLRTGAQVLEEVHKVLETAGGKGPQSSPSADTDRETGRFDLDAFMRKSHEFAQKQGNYSEYTGIQLQRTQIGDFTVWQPAPAGQTSADGQQRSRGGGRVSSCFGGSSST